MDGMKVLKGVKTGTLGLRRKQDWGTGMALGADFFCHNRVGGQVWAASGPWDEAQEAQGEAIPGVLDTSPSFWLDGSAAEAQVAQGLFFRRLKNL